MSSSNDMYMKGFTGVSTTMSAFSFSLYSGETQLLRTCDLRARFRQQLLLMAVLRSAAAAVDDR